jgi:hypothetical protein
VDKQILSLTQSEQSHFGISKENPASAFPSRGAGEMTFPVIPDLGGGAEGIEIACI